MHNLINIVLFEPEIPNNTGSIIRLCANIGATLHLIKPYGFEINDKRLRRAGLDYHDLICVKEYENFNNYLLKADKRRIFCLTTKTNNCYSDNNYQIGDTLIFGSETKGLPQYILNDFKQLTIPMQNNSRSINLANAVAIASYELYRQLNFIS